MKVDNVFTEFLIKLLVYLAIASAFVYSMVLLKDYYDNYDDGNYFKGLTSNQVFMINSKHMDCSLIKKEVIKNGEYCFQSKTLPINKDKLFLSGFQGNYNLLNKTFSEIDENKYFIFTYEDKYSDIKNYFVTILKQKKIGYIVVFSFKVSEKKNNN